MDGPSLTAGAIPIGEIVGVTPRQATFLAVTGELPSVSAQAAFEQSLSSEEPAWRGLACALQLMADCEGDVAESATDAERADGARELVRCWFTLTLSSIHLDVLAGGQEPAAEICAADAWIRGLRGRVGQDPAGAVRSAVELSVAKTGRVPGFGHATLAGLDPRFVALHAIVSRRFADDRGVHCMQLAVRLAPDAIARAGKPRELANLFLPMAVGLAAVGADVAKPSLCLVGASRRAARAIAAAQTTRTP